MPDVELRVRRSGVGWSAVAAPRRARGAAAPIPSGSGGRAPSSTGSSRRVPGLRLHFVAVGKRAHQGSRGPDRDDAVPVCLTRGLGRLELPAARGPGLRNGEGGPGAPHRVAQRLHARRGAADRARDLPLPPQLERLERHRLQRARRQVRHDLRGPRRRPRPGRWSGPTRRGSTRRRRASRTSATTRPSGRATRRLRPPPTLHPLEARRARPAAVRTGHAHERGRVGEPLPGGQRGSRVERVLGHRDTGKTACPGDALYDQLDEIRALVASGTPFADLLRAA